MKTEIYNLIILDESGSMSSLSQATITGCNETLNTIRSAQKEFADTQDHYVSIYLFQSNPHVPSRYIIKNEPIDAVSDINHELYRPWGATPLYDAVGATLVDLKSLTDTKDLAIGNVTIITDGMENSSEHFSREKVAKLIAQLKEMGWSFNFIGANIDVQGTAQSLNIDNALEFQQDLEGTKAMFATERESRKRWSLRAHNLMAEVQCSENAAPEAQEEERKSLRTKLKEAAKNYFSEDL